MTESSKQEKSLYMTRLMTPDMANFSGKVHGGSILKLLDEAAYSCAARYCQTYVVTASLDQVVFRESITVGDLVTFKCNVIYVGRTSMEIGIRVEAQNLTSKTKYHAISCYFTMVSVNEQGVAQQVPQLRLESDAEKKLFQAGKMRCDMRREIQERNRALHVGIDF